MKHRLLLLITSLACFFLVSSVFITPSQQVYAAASTSSTQQEVPGLDCPVFDLSFAFCPIIKGMAFAVAQLDTFINSQLSVGTPGASDDPNQIFCNRNSQGNAKKTCTAYYQAWNSVRNIALGLMVIAGIIVLIAQSLGFEILDAYTIRKVLPRLLICAVGITLSWQLMQFFVTLTNDLAFGIRYLIYQPFADLPNATITGGGTKAVSSLLALTAINALGWVGLMTYIGTAMLAVLVAALVLILRQMIIILLIIFAPIAIVAYVLPNTQKVYKLWWDSFSKALLMFAIIAGLIAVGRVFASVSALSSSNPIAQLAGFAAYFLPYFVIPATFRFAGGAIRQIGGFVNDRSRGGFDRLRKARADNTANRIKRARSGGLYRDDFGRFKLRPGGKQRSIGKVANAFGNWTFDFDEQSRVSAGQVPGPGRWLFGRGSDIMKEEIEDQRIEHSKKAAGKLDLHYQSGRAISGQMQYFTADGPLSDVTNEHRQRLDQRFGTKFATDENGNRYATAWRGVAGKGETEMVADILSHGGMGARLASQELESKAGEIGNLKAHEDTRRADIETIGLLSAAKAGRLENSEIVARRHAMEEEPGRIIDRRQQPGYGAKEMALLQDIATQKRASQSRGHGIQFNERGEAYSVYADPTSTEAQTSLMRLSTQDIGASKSEDIDALRETMIYGASEYKMKRSDADPTKVEYILDAQGNKIKREGVELERAKALRARIQAMAQYSYGDTDVGRKLADVANVAEIPLYNASDMNPVLREQLGQRAAAPPDDQNAGGGAGGGGP